MDEAKRDDRVCGLLAMVGVVLGVSALVTGILPLWVTLGAFVFVVGLPLVLVGLTRRVMLH